MLTTVALAFVAVAQPSESFRWRVDVTDQATKEVKTYQPFRDKLVLYFFSNALGCEVTANPINKIGGGVSQSASINCARFKPSKAPPASFDDGKILFSVMGGQCAFDPTPGTVLVDRGHTILDLYEPAVRANAGQGTATTLVLQCDPESLK